MAPSTGAIALYIKFIFKHRFYIHMQGNSYPKEIPME